MKKIITLFALVIVILSCSKQKDFGDELTNTVWSNETITLEFTEDSRVFCDINGTLEWSGIYKIYAGKAIDIYKADPNDEDNWPMVYTGTFTDNTMLLDNNKITLTKK